IALKSILLGPPKDWASFIHSTHIELKPSLPEEDATTCVTRVYLDHREVTHDIRDALVSKKVSELAHLASIRTPLLYKQRLLAQPKTGYQGVAMDGRDIGTVVLPNAHLKIYLTAQAHLRALRRWKEENASPEALEQIHLDIVRRDHLDQTRELGQLKVADDAVVVDTSTLTKEETVNLMVKMVKERQSQLSENSVTN
ncbi:hypothetical protein HMI54_005844, partial [Coelomomyces lativittatus]